MKNRYEIFNADCLEQMKSIPDKSIDMILCDLPYGTTQNKWDEIIPFDKLWEQYNRIIKDKHVIALFGANPFSAKIITSNLKNYKYNWIWEKSKATGYLNSKKRPLIAHEDVLIFSNGTPRYYPMMSSGEPYKKGFKERPTDNYGKQKAYDNSNEDGLRYPRTVKYFKTAESEGDVLHPTQKPVALLEYLIKTYTQENEIVLDNTMGSGSCGIPYLNTNRKFIGIEKDKKYFKIAEERIEKHFNFKTKRVLNLSS